MQTEQIALARLYADIFRQQSGVNVSQHLHAFSCADYVVHLKVRRDSITHNAVFRLAYEHGRLATAPLNADVSLEQVLKKAVGEGGKGNRFRKACIVVSVGVCLVCVFPLQFGGRFGDNRLSGVLVTLDGYAVVSVAEDERGENVGTVAGSNQSRQSRLAVLLADILARFINACKRLCAYGCGCGVAVVVVRLDSVFNVFHSHNKTSSM